MNYTDPFVLHDNVLLVPCADLGDDVRKRITYDEGDYTLSRRRGRALVQVIDRDTAALLELFRRPRTIVDAVLESSVALGKDAEELLDELLPHIGMFVHDRVLVPVGSEREGELGPQFESGAAFGKSTIVRCVNLVDDREVYELRGAHGSAALKIARGDPRKLRRMFDNEAAILRHLDGSSLAPGLLEKGVHEGRPYLILEWISGVDADVAAAQRRHDGAALIELCASIAATYAALHERGVIHGDVHAQNMLVGDERVRLLDFGYARFVDRQPRMAHAAIPHLFEPEYFAAERKGRRLPASMAGEQYMVAATLYLLIAGQPYLEFRLDREEMVGQIETEPPLPFAQRGVPPWPEVERILFRALEKDPARRYASMAEMAASLAEVRATIALLDRTLRAFAPGGEMYASRDPKVCADAAMALVRIAQLRGDAALLALAAVWHSRAPHAHAAGAMIAAVRGEVGLQIAETKAWVASGEWRRAGETAAVLLEMSEDVPEAAEALRAVVQIEKEDAAPGPDLGLAVLIAKLAALSLVGV